MDKVAFEKFAFFYNLGYQLAKEAQTAPSYLVRKAQHLKDVVRYILKSHAEAARKVRPMLSAAEREALDSYSRSLGRGARRVYETADRVMRGEGGMKDLQIAFGKFDLVRTRQGEFVGEPIFEPGYGQNITLPREVRAAQKTPFMQTNIQRLKKHLAEIPTIAQKFYG